MSTKGELHVKDELEFTKALKFSEILHTDTQRLRRWVRTHFATKVEGASLDVKLVSSTPGEAKPVENIVMGPGKPGSVDKGTLEKRGERLVFASDSAVSSAAFEWMLRF